MTSPSNSNVPGDIRTWKWFDHSHESPEYINCPPWEMYVYSARCPDKEPPNEDAAAIVGRGQTVALIVADGCGGMAAGERAARIAIEQLVTSLNSNTKRSACRSSILDGIEAANERILQRVSGAATTLAVVELSALTLRGYHIGDSSILLVGRRGRLKFQTRAHSPVAYGVEAGLISAHEAMHHDDLHLVSNIVGTRDTHIEIGPQRQLAKRDTLLVASDGVLDNVPTDELVDIIRKGPLNAAATRLAHVTRQRMRAPEDGAPSKLDDATFILCRRIASTATG